MQQRMPSTARSTSTSESTSGLPPSWAAATARLIPIGRHQFGSAAQDFDAPLCRQPAVAIAKQRVSGGQRDVGGGLVGDFDGRDRFSIEGGEDFEGPAGADCAGDHEWERGRHC